MNTQLAGQELFDAAQKVIKHLQSEAQKPDGGEAPRLLENAFEAISGQLLDLASIDDQRVKLRPSVVIGILVLHEYFSHRGDWNKMLACLDQKSQLESYEHR